MAIATRTNAPAGPRKAGCCTSGARRRGIRADTYREVNPAAIQREIRALTAQLLTITTSKGTRPQTIHRGPLYGRILR